MTTWTHLADLYLDKYPSDSLAQAKQLHADFLATFPISKLREMSVDEYALGINKTGSFSWWLEYHTPALGSIKGGAASKHIIFYSNKDGEWKYPSSFVSVEEAWAKLRADILELIESHQEGQPAPLNPNNLLYGKDMLKGKLLFLYHPDKFLPIYKQSHLHQFLHELGVEEREYKQKDNVESNLLFKQKLADQLNLADWHPIQVTNFAYQTFMNEENCYKIAPGSNAELWDDCQKNGYIRVGWDELEELSQYPEFEEFYSAFKKQKYYETENKTKEKANELWSFYNLKPGDKIIANRGISQIVGIGTVTEQGYAYRPDLPFHKHVVHVDWDDAFALLDIEPQRRWGMKTIAALSKEKYMDLLRGKQAMGPAATAHTDEEPFFLRLERALERKGQIVLYGPPGTGKTYAARKYIEWRWNKEQANNQGVPAASVKALTELCTFHPSFTYEDFMEGYKPMAQSNGQVAFQLEEGILQGLCQRAHAQPDTPYFLIIDEMNRGNVPKIFGEIITLLEKDKRGVEVTLPQSKRPFSIPPNLFIIATMNTSDRSIKMMDAALKRRFAFIECMPRTDLLEGEIEDTGISPAIILQVLNKKLTALAGRDKQIGHAYFMKDGAQITTVDELKEIYEMEIIPLVQEYCFDDYAQLGEIIGKGFIDEENQMINAEIFTQSDDLFSAEVRNSCKG